MRDRPMKGTHSLPGRDALVDTYRRLLDKHPHARLPLESALPAKLRPEKRDKYRTTMTMILSQEIADYDLSIALGKLFWDYPDMNRIRNLDSWDGARGVLRDYGFKVDGPPKLNVDRFWGFKELYFGEWNQTITPSNIEALSTKRGYGPKMTRTLYAYVSGDPNVLPLDGKAFKALTRRGLYVNVNINVARADMEAKLAGTKDVVLIDFHEMLRFDEQSRGENENGERRIIVGWNAWRLLCSMEREGITEDWQWIYEHLVKDKDIAQELWRFYGRISKPSQPTTLPTEVTDAGKQIGR